MMLEHDADFHTFLERLGQAIVRIVIHQRTGIDPHPAVSFDDHLAEVTHQLAALICGEVLGHTMFGHLRNLLLGAGWVEIGKRHDGRIRGHAYGLKKKAIPLIDRVGVFPTLHEAGDGDLKTGLIQPAQGGQGLAEIALASEAIVRLLVRVIQTDAKAERMGFILQGQDLVQPIHQRLGPVGQDQAGAMLQGMGQNRHHVGIHEGLAAGKGEFFNTQFHRFVHKRQHVLGGEKLDPSVAGLGAFQAKRTAQIAIRAGVKPTLFAASSSIFWMAKPECNRT